MTTCVKYVTASELKEMDPRQFEREYFRWAEWAWDDYYVEDAQSYFIDMYRPKGIEIESLRYSISYSQGDYASFDGRVFLADWMEAVPPCPGGPTYAERYPALYLACREDGSYMGVRGEDSRFGWRASFEESWMGVGPCGVFSGLDEEDWEELVADQAREAGLEVEVLRYCKDIGHELFRYLQDSYESATSEEAFIESCEANDVKFEIEVEENDDGVHS